MKFEPAYKIKKFDFNVEYPFTESKLVELFKCVSIIWNNTIVHVPFELAEKLISIFNESTDLHVVINNNMYSTNGLKISSVFEDWQKQSKIATKLNEVLSQICEVSQTKIEDGIYVKEEKGYYKKLSLLE